MLRIVFLVVQIAACGSPKLDEVALQRELVSGAGRLKSTTYTLDAEVGRAIEHES